MIDDGQKRVMSDLPKFTGRDYFMAATVVLGGSEVFGQGVLSGVLIGAMFWTIYAGWTGQLDD